MFKIFFYFKYTIKLENCRIICWKTRISTKFFIRSIKSLFLWKNSQITNKKKKTYLKKVVICPLNIACMLLFDIQNGSPIFQNII